MPELMVILKKFFAYNDKKWELSVGTYSAKGYSIVETTLSIMTFFEWGLSRYSYFHQICTSSIKVHLQ